MNSRCNKNFSLLICCTLSIFVLSYAADNQIDYSSNPYALFDIDAAESIILPQIPDLEVQSHTVILDDKCPFTKDTIRDFLKQAKQEDTFFILAAYKSVNDTINYADGESLLNWLLHKPNNANVDPLTGLNIMASHYYECIYIDGILHIEHIGNINDAEIEGTKLSDFRDYAWTKFEEGVLKQKEEFDQKLQLLGWKNSGYDAVCARNAQLALKKRDIHRACCWYKLSDHPVALTNLGNLYKTSGKLENAIPPLEKAAVSQNPEVEKVAKETLGIIYMDKGDFPMSKEWLAKAMAAGSKTAIRHLGIVHRKEGNIPEAITCHHMLAQSGSILGMLHLFGDLYSYNDHHIASKELTEYAHKISAVLNASEIHSSEEAYVRNTYSTKDPVDYQHALEMIRKYMVASD